MLGDIGLPELLVIFIIVLVLFGPGKLPDVGKAIGEALRGFKKALKEPDNTIAERSNDKDENGYRPSHPEGRESIRQKEDEENGRKSNENCNLIFGSPSAPR